MANDNILKKVIKLLSTMADTEDEITEDSELIDDLGISSMDILVLLSHLEEEFKVKVSEKEIRKMHTVGDVVEVVSRLKK